MIQNFCTETTDKLAYYGYKVEDISWIGNRSIEIPIHEFFDAARHTDYNSGYGSAAMPVDLLIVMKDGSYFERGEYDGSEWWRYIPIIERPRTKSHLKQKSFKLDDHNYSHCDPTLGDFLVKHVIIR